MSRACPDPHPDGRAPLTDAVVTHIVVPVVTLLPGLQDPVPTGAAVVYRVVHRIEGGQLAKETHQVTKDSSPGRAGQVIGTGDRSSGSRGALPRSAPDSWVGKALIFCRPELCKGRKYEPDQLSALAVQGRETVGNLGSEEKVLFGEPGHEELLGDSEGGCAALPWKQNSAPASLLAFSTLKGMCLSWGCVSRAPALVPGWGASQGCP